MGRRALSRGFLLVALAAISLARQNASNPSQTNSTGQYSLSGIVVNGATGEPIPRALVHLNAQSQQMTMSGPDGRFEFDNLAAGAAMVFGQKPGFYNQQEMGLTSAPIPVLQIGRDTDIKVSLYPMGAIAGRVTDMNGDPIEGIDVKAIYQHVVDGTVFSDQRNSATTDDSGEYRIASLVPGKYIVATATRPVRVLSPQIRSFGENFDEVYPGIYFPGAADASGAVPVQVMPGQEAEANFSENPARAYAISGTVNGDSSDRMFISLRNREGDQIATRIQRRGNRFKFLDVVPGDYSVFVNEGNGDQMLYGEVQVGVASADVNGISVEPFPGATLHVQIQYDASRGNSQALAQMPGQLRLEPTHHSAGNLGNYRVDVPGQIVERVVPGTYRVEFQSSGPWYVSELRSGQTDLIRNDFVVTPGAQPETIQVVLRTGGATLTGKVKGAEGLASVIVLALPDGDSAAEPRSYTVAPQFSLSGLAPGSYRMYAFTSIAGLEYRNPEAMRKYQDQGVTVNLSENETKQIDLPLAGGS
ncbi:MAG: carboxypeptidase regulatory-like domain-containing protein [Bryobacteraceae bacterium]